MPVNEQGYLRPTYDELLAQRIAQAQELFGEDIDTSNASPLGKFIRLAVQDLADAYEAQEVIYYARFPHTATGHNLDRLLPFAGITRNPATRAEHVIQFKGTVGYEVPVGFLVGTSGEEEFYLVNPVTLDSEGSGEGIVQCTEPGTVGNVSLGEITEIVNPDANVESIAHVSIETIGEDTESDVELRKRFDIAIEGSGSATVASIRGAVMRVNGVDSCSVVENTGDEADSDGRPAHSFEVFVFAPESLNQEVAEAIFSKKPAGIATYGSVSQTVLDVSGNEQIVKFSRVAELDLHIKVIVQRDNDFELDGVAQIRSALAGYINSLSNGEDVIFTSLYKYIYGVAGVRDVTSLTISTDGSTYNAANVIIGTNQVARLDEANVTIEVTSYEDS